MSKKHELVLIPNYVGSFEHKVDSKGRVSLPSIIRRTISERNRYNLLNNDFELIRDINDYYVLAFKGIPFAAPKPNEATTKEALDTSSLDRLVYIGTGTIKGSRPDFFGSGPDKTGVGADTVFIYAIIDAQRMLYDKEWRKSEFASNHRIAKIDGQGRVKLSPFEQQLCVNSDHILLPLRESEQEIRGNWRYTVVTGHPSFFCATLTNKYQPML